MPATREEIFGRLAALGIETSTLPYPEHRTVEESKVLRGDMPSAFTKNLLLKDNEGAARVRGAGACACAPRRRSRRHHAPSG